MVSNWTMRHNWFLAVLVFLLAIAMQLTAVELSGIQSLPGDYSQLILTLEFADTPQIVADLFEVLTDRQEERLLLNTRIDFLFLLAYGLFLAGISWAAYKEQGNKLFLLAVFASFITMLGDVLENLQLFKIFADPYSAEMADTTTQLQMFTWLKWGAIAFALAIIALYFFRKPWWGKVFGLVFIAPLITAAVGYLGSPQFTELMALSIMISFLILIIYTFVYSFRKEPPKI